MERRACRVPAPRPAGGSGQPMKGAGMVRTRRACARPLPWLSARPAPLGPLTAPLGTDVAFGVRGCRASGWRQT